MALKASANNRMLYGVLAAGAVVVLLLLVSILPSGGDAESLDTLRIPCRIEPAWETAAAAPSGAAEGDGAPEILVYLDTSHPMGGYLAPTGVDGEPSFRSVAQLVPGHLVGRFSGSLRWVGVDTTLRTLDSDLRLTRGLFTGSETRLDLALAEIVESIESGRAEVAVLITDLVSTSGPEGAMGAVEPIQRWNRSVGVRRGHYDLGILAARAEYWGVDSSSCTGPGSLGCWFSEHANRYVPMTRAVRRPLYFLFFGRSTDGERAPEGMGRVEEAGRSLEAALGELGFDTRWELVTAASRGTPGTMVCSVALAEVDPAAGDSQYALYRTGDGFHECRRDESVRLSCCVVEGSGEAASCSGGAWEIGQAEATWPEVTVHPAGDGLDSVIDCSALRRSPPETPLLFENVVASAAFSPVASWRDWSASSDETEDSLDGTLQMDLFVETVRLRPDAYRVDVLEPILRFAP